MIDKDRSARCRVAVVGAGVVGACAAYALRKRGLDVALLERDEPGAGCSFGNLGAISMSSVVPLATSGTLKTLPSMLSDPDSPLFLPIGYFPRAAPWLVQFMLSARSKVVEQSSAELARLHDGAVDAHTRLAREIGVPELIVQRGQLHLYPSNQAFQNDESSWALRSRRGLSFQRLDAAGIAKLEPAIGSRYPVGIFLEGDATVLNPGRYVQAIVSAFIAEGGRFVKRNVKRLQRNSDGSWLICSDADLEGFDHVVIAAGAWSRELLQGVGVRLALESQRGYHVQFSDCASLVSRSVLLTDRKVFFAPMEAGLRVGGTVEIAGLDNPPNPRRVAILERIAKDIFPELVGVTSTHWMGHRPCMPDSVPRIGSAGIPGLHMSVGHGHLGLTDSVLSAERIVQSVLGSSSAEQLNAVKVGLSN
ncbi:FAD-dependent oxidoreductase [Ottowia caeni]|uniref:NAD(P)/FAD-dependent oxidoreductase n=1 Tax=Ottowia caeni TaxID=2870339 RepID=UPI001E4C0790|nr:FAD-binding oxidoreductase [Ottowia caeni]